jgi:hypothetical protein
MMAPIDFSELTDEQTQALFDAYLAAADDRLAWLRDEVEAVGGPVNEDVPAGRLLEVFRNWTEERE